MGGFKWVVMCILLLVVWGDEIEPVSTKLLLKQPDWCKRESSKKWVYFDWPKKFDETTFKTRKEIVMNFGSIIPGSWKVKKVKLLLSMGTGTAKRYYFQTMRTRVIDGDEEFVHFTIAETWSQNGVSFNSETIEIPSCLTREIRFTTDTIRYQNTAMRFYITGYLPA